jgi:hypothetical protein
MDALSVSRAALPPISNEQWKILGWETLYEGEGALQIDYEQSKGGN